MGGDFVAVTGANGFVGSTLCARADREGWLIRRMSRCQAVGNGVTVGALGSTTDWSIALRDVHVVIHLAARVHVMRDMVADPLAAYREVNTEGTLNLASQAAALGVKRFVYISSIKVNGEETSVGRPFTEEDRPVPFDPYGISKLEAEQGLRVLAAETGLEVVIIRPPLVYGPGVRANFLSMMHWLNRGVPLPLGAIYNKRSLLSLDNLVDLIITCIDHPAAASQVFFVSDGEDLSTTELLQRTAAALGKPARLLPVPQRALTLALNMLGKKELAQRLCGSLQVDIRKARNLLGWNPPVTIEAALLKTVRHFVEHQW